MGKEILEGQNGGMRAGGMTIRDGGGYGSRGRRGGKRRNGRGGMAKREVGCKEEKSVKREAGSCTGRGLDKGGRRKDKK